MNEMIKNAVERAMATIREALEDMVEACTQATREHVIAALGSELSVTTDRKLTKGVTEWAIGKRPRKKGPIQLCPAPRCKNRAAPVYGMLCKDHKDTTKKIVAKWREDRRAEKTGVKPTKAKTKVKAKAKTKVKTKSAKTKTTKASRKKKAKAIKVTKATKTTDTPLSIVKDKNGTVAAAV